jgi:hypothetical protein
LELAEGSGGLDSASQHCLVVSTQTVGPHAL